MIKTFILYNLADNTFAACQISQGFDARHLPVGVERYLVHTEDTWPIGQRNHLLANESYEESWHYIGTEYTIDQIKETFPADTLLAFAMEHHGWNRVVRTASGNYYPLRENDIVHPPIAISSSKTLPAQETPEK